ncbi:hypothetical protein EYE40_04100 [Glaciihabitans arcticus]|uniref:Uncharacterized protein n=1 Tax=Glaciihabitans arcticus TaxID=2668039 RepID=A0A4Q9GRF2_9MICO|nr:hypothetical protein [Glaciihabitans arcticus]TBN56644.1 hypothetical protein EYE40_04100 [Glaciihabitans arcticus]
MTDPTKIRNQPALTSSSGAVWLIVGGLFAVISIVVLIPLVMRQPAGLAMGGIVAVVVLYLAMVVIRLRVRPLRRRLGLLAICMLTMAAIGLACTLIVSAVEWNLV